MAQSRQSFLYVALACARVAVDLTAERSFFPTERFNAFLSKVNTQLAILEAVSSPEAATRPHLGAEQMLICVG